MDRAARSRITAYYKLLITYEDDVLSEEDALAASIHGEQVYTEHTDWTATACIDRALDVAFAVKATLVRRQHNYIQEIA